MKSVSSLIQYFLLALIVIYYAINGFVLAASFGALVSLSNTWIFNWYTNKQKKLVDIDAQKSFRMAINSSVTRTFSLILLALIGLGLLEKADIQNESKEKPAYKKYFMHGTSHHMGLDTHDYGLLNDPMVENMVFTVEPGIYLPKEGFGVRLEDDVVVQNSGEPINLMKDIPIEIEEIEDLMNN